MSMTLANVIVGLLLVALGAAVFMLRSEAAKDVALKLLRNRTLDGVLIVIASVWFLWIVAHLGQADFGDYKNILFILFFAVAVGSWFYVKDFLGVRMVSVIYMLASWHFLASAFGHYDVFARLFMVSAVYAGLVVALYLGTVPFRARDFAEWLCKHAKAAKITGAILAAYGAWLLIIPAIFY